METRATILPQQLDDTTENIEVIVKYSGTILFLEEQNMEVEILDKNYAIITLSLFQIDTLYNYKEIEYIELPKNLSYFLNQELIATCATEVQEDIDYGLRGQGTIVGIIDSGIDYAHPDFINSDGTSRILYIWDQSLTTIPPEGFKSGTEYTNSQINEALKQEDSYDIIDNLDPLGHGTAVAGVACGNGNASVGKEIGIAPEASIIVVKLGQRGFQSFTKSTEIMRGLKYIITKAEELNMPVAINISYGSNNGSHIGNSLFESFINDIALKWKTAIVVATGNESSAGHHYFEKLRQDETIDIEFSVIPHLKSLYITLWKDFVDDFTLELIAPNGTSTGIINNERRNSEFQIKNTIININYGSPNHYNVEQEIFFSFKSPTSILDGIWELRVTGTEVVNGVISLWMPTFEEVGGSTFFKPNIDFTLTLPSTAGRVISVGAYNSKSRSIAIFSGKGHVTSWYTAKPDLVAPGVNVISTRSGGGYDSFSGTSIAAPFVTGATALMMQWGIVDGNDIFLYGEKLKAFLRKGANRKFTITYPDRAWGYGTLCIKQTIDYLSYYQRDSVIKNRFNKYDK